MFSSANASAFADEGGRIILHTALKKMLIGVFALILSAEPCVYTATDEVNRADTGIASRAARVGAGTDAVHDTIDGFYGELSEHLSGHETDFVITATKETGDPIRATSLRKFAAEHTDGLYYWLLKSYPAARLTENGDTIAFEYHNMKYKSTAEKHAYALTKAKEIAADMELEGRDALTKVEKICEYADKRWTYDATLTKELAYDVFTTGAGTCLGLTFAARMLLDEAGVPSKAMVGLGESKVWHIWLIVQIDGYWYNIDPSYPRDPRFYLAGDYSPWFTLSSLYTTEEMKAKYPAGAVA